VSDALSMAPRLDYRSEPMPADTAGPNAKNMSIIVTKGTLDWAYPPFILATTAAALDVKVSMFFTFYGLPLLLKKLDLQISPLGKPDMAMPVLGMHMKMPNMVAMLPGVNGMATRMMKNLMKKKGVASIEDLRAAAVEGEIEMIGCQMTMDLFEFKKKDMIPGIKIGGAATYMERALKCDINLFI
jgi:peroxiredoxin family protein